MWWVFFILVFYGMWWWFSGSMPFGRIHRAKRILKKMWWGENKMVRMKRFYESKLEGIMDNYGQFVIETQNYYAILDRCEDPDDGSSWFEFELIFRGKRIFKNTNWRSNEHYYRNPKEVIFHAKQFSQEYYGMKNPENVIVSMFPYRDLLTGFQNKIRGRINKYLQ